MTAPMNLSNSSHFYVLMRKNITLSQSDLYFADVNKRGADGTNALYWAIKHHNMQNAKFLIERGISLRVDNHKHALFFAIHEGNLSFVTYLIDKGIDINISDCNYRSLLIHAAEYHQYDIARYLLENGAKPFCMDAFNNMAIDYAREKDMIELIEKYMD